MYLKSKPLAIITHDDEGFFLSFGNQGCHSLCIDLIGLVLPPVLGDSYGWPSLGYSVFLRNSVK